MIARWLVPSRWRFNSRDRVVIGADDASDIGFSSEEGEELDDVDDDRRHALSLDTHIPVHTDSIRRLSREYVKKTSIPIATSFTLEQKD